MARVTTPDGTPLLLEVPLFGAPLAFQVWRVDVGRVPLLLLDAELPENDAVQRWTSARLYEGNRAVRLAQYGLLGIGGARVLAGARDRAGRVHLNEGHPALAALELAARGRSSGALASRRRSSGSRQRFVFTTHTPVAAGNETYAPEEFLPAFADLRERLGLDEEAFLDLCRGVPGEDRPARDDAARDPDEPPPERRQPAARRGLARRCGSRSSPSAVEPPITHVTNGAHLPTFVSEPIRALLDAPPRRRLAAARRPRPPPGRRVREIPNAELWAARCEARARLVDYLRDEGAAGQPAARRAARLRARGSRRASIPTRSRSASPAGSRPTSASTS